MTLGIMQLNIVVEAPSKVMKYYNDLGSCRPRAQRAGRWSLADKYVAI